MEFSFCHFNDYRNVVEAWTREHDIIHRRVSLSQTTIVGSNGQNIPY